jgi:methylated-DNA-[protein]-cysteine S-methyltransferase
MSENGEQSPRKSVAWSQSNAQWLCRYALTSTENKMTYFYKTMPSPVGLLKLVASDAGLAAILWENDDPKRVRLSPLEEAKNHPTLLETERQLHAYFEGKLAQFSLKLDFAGTAFQKKVWTALLAIPFGETRSYGQIATQIGHPQAVRAVGAANGKNPLSIVAPCHRVIGANGKLTGFAGGLEVKAILLKLESSRESFKKMKIAGAVLPRPKKS